jgi:4-hydroxy 2-oxovalerate aldolase
MTAPNEKAPADGSAEKWITYREQIKVLDCTIRDGGLMNDHRFDDRFVKAVYDACVQSGVDYMELGYMGSKQLFSREKCGPWRFCEEADLRRIVGDNPTGLKLAAMADAEKCDYKTDVLPKSESVLDMIRVACYIHQIPLALDMVKDAHDKGYETTLNLMAASTVPESELEPALEMVAQSEALAVYLVDSFGSFYSEEIHRLMERYLGAMKPAGKEVGIHAHNNMQLAYANTIEAVIKGANFVDATMAGLGRGAGNCPMELILGFLHNPKYHLRPVLQCVQETVEPMRKDINWGFDLAYMMTGLLNLHPRFAIKFNAGPDRGDFVKFYDQIIEEV